MNNQELLKEEAVVEETPVQASLTQKLRKTFYVIMTILTFAFALFAFYAFNSGLVSIDCCDMSSAGLTLYLQSFTEYVNCNIELDSSYMIPSVFIILFAIFYVIYSLIFVISAICLIVSFLKNIFSKADAKLRYSKVSKRALIFASLPIAFIGACYLLPEARLTSLGTIYVTLAGILFVVSFFGNKVFTELAKEEKNWVEFGLDSGKFVVLCLVFGVLFSSFSKFGIEEVISVFSNIGSTSPVDAAIILSRCLLQFILVLQVCKILRAFVRYYALNNAKKEVNSMMKKRTIVLIVIIALAYALGVYYKGLDNIFASVMAYKDTFLLMLIGSIVILCALDYKESTKEKNIIRN